MQAKYPFIKNYVEDGTIFVKYVAPENNLADPMTKNVGINHFNSLFPYIYRENQQNLGGSQEKGEIVYSVNFPEEKRLQR